MNPMRQLEIVGGTVCDTEIGYVVHFIHEQNTGDINMA